jgi:DNA-binding MarR family transcriptional regulator
VASRAPRSPSPLRGPSAAERIATALERLGVRIGPTNDVPEGGAQDRVLRALAAARRRPGDLARELGLSRPTVTKAVQALERKGLLTRAAGPDRRSLTLSLTPEGERASERTSGARLAEAAAGLPARDREALASGLERLLEALTSEPRRQ